MAKVYIVNRGSHDFSAALIFGTLVELSDGPYNRFATGNIFRHFQLVLKDSSPDDYLILSGLTVMTSIAVGILASMHGKVNLLLHNEKPGEGEMYVKRTVNFRTSFFNKQEIDAKEVQPTLSTSDGRRRLLNSLPRHTRPKSDKR